MYLGNTCQLPPGRATESVYSSCLSPLPGTASGGATAAESCAALPGRAEAGVERDVLRYPQFHQK